MREFTYRCDRCGGTCEPGNATLPEPYILYRELADENTGPVDLCKDCGAGLREWWNGDWAEFCERYGLIEPDPAGGAEDLNEGI
jgi:hypothetical protein